MINVQQPITARQYTVSAGNAALNQAAGKSFGDCLGIFSDGTAAGIPDKWCSDTDKFGSGVAKAVRYMKESLGIDPDNRTPTYRITDEQMEWLKSRHNLDDIYKTKNDTCEDGCCGATMSWWDENFLSDLVYLNVISPEDAKSFGWIAFPGSESGKVYAASDSGSADSGRFSIIDVAAKVLQKQKSHIDSIYEKYENNLSLMLKQDEEYLETAQNLLEKNQIWLDILKSLYN